MKVEDFIDKIVDEGFMWLDKKDIIIKRGELKLRIPKETIEKHSWAKLIKQIGSFDVYHMTRVVGYYSRVQNWNESKVGELQDRHSGDYKVGEK